VGNLAHHPGPPSHPREEVTVRDVRPLGQAGVAAIGVQTDRLFLAVKASYRAESILGMSYERASFESERPRSPVRLAFAAFGGF
jgi:hypothetical protein